MEKEISNSGLRKLLVRGEVAYFCHLQGENQCATTTTTWPELVTLLEQFQDVLAEPQSLPPDRPTNHKITLFPNEQPVNVRPYRYPHYLKNEIEKLTNEMLRQGFITHNVSPFSSPVLLVKKRDRSWRFCVDYKALNAITNRDRFPISTMDELMDELHGAVVLSKLDLRAGYHQIRVAEGNREMNAFRTHQGHFEFTVLLFCLSNVPATFQVTMNQLFQPLLCKY